MGVPRLFKYVVDSFPKAVNHFRKGQYTMKVDNLYLDANGLLHAAAQFVFHYGTNKSRTDKYKNLSIEDKLRKVYFLFFENIKEMTKIVIPQKILYIAIDGPAPLAKQAQQRQRRYVAARERLFPLQGNNRDPQSGEGLFPQSENSLEEKFDSTQITPGTIFMHELSKYLNYAIRYEMSEYGYWKNLSVYFSPPTVPGEGEHKIMDFIRAMPLDKREKESHCLFGPDGDLIMLTLAAHVPKMFLLREDQYRPGYLHILNMGIIRKSLSYNLGQKDGLRRRKRNLNDITDDFILEGFFVGNDFVPKIQMFHMLEDGLEMMLDTYACTSNGGMNNFITVKNRFDMKGFEKFVDMLAKSEVKFLAQQAKIKVKDIKFKNETLLKYITTTIPTKTQSTGNHRMVYEIDFEGYREAYYKKAGIEDSSFKEIEVMCKDYIRSLIWIFDYYVHGLPDWRWAYKWHYAPFMTDLSKVIKSLSQNDYIDLSFFEKGTPALPFEQLLSVLPPPSANLIPKSYRRLMCDEKSPLVKSGIYPHVNSFYIDYEGKVKDYQGVAILPFVNFKKIRKSYENVNKELVKDGHDPNIYHRNQVGKVGLFKYCSNYRANYRSSMGNISNHHIKKITLQM